MEARDFALRGRNPAKWKRGCANPLTLTAEIAALGPGTGTTGTPCSTARRTSSAPGSLTPGVPASVTSASEAPCASRCRMGSARRASSYAGSAWNGFFSMPRCFSSWPVWRVSSATTPSQAASTSRARAVRSCRLPIGVATTYRGTGASVGRVERAWEVREERPAGLVHDRDDVEASAPGRTSPAGQEVPRRPHQPLLLGGAHCLLRPAEGGGRPRAHLDEDEQIALLRHQVHLATRTAVLARDDPVPARREQLLGGPLAQVAQALARSAHACTTRSAVPCGGSSAVRWMICVWAAMPFSILATSARLAGSRAENASSTTTGSRLYAATRSSSARRSAAYARSFSAGGRPWYGPLRPSALESTQCRFSSVVLDTMRLSVSADRWAERRCPIASHTSSADRS